jgi:hypothetical protein
MLEMRNAYNISENLKGRIHLKVMGVDERMLLK